MSRPAPLQMDGVLPAGEHGANDNGTAVGRFDATAIAIGTFFAVATLLAAVGVVASCAKLGWL